MRPQRALILFVVLMVAGLLFFNMFIPSLTAPTPPGEAVDDAGEPVVPSPVDTGQVGVGDVVIAEDETDYQPTFFDAKVDLYSLEYGKSFKVKKLPLTVNFKSERIQDHLIELKEAKVKFWFRRYSDDSKRAFEYYFEGRRVGEKYDTKATGFTLGIDVTDHVQRAMDNGDWMWQFVVDGSSVGDSWIFEYLFLRLYFTSDVAFRVFSSYDIGGFANAWWLSFGAAVILLMWAFTSSSRRKWW